MMYNRLLATAAALAAVAVFDTNLLARYGRRKDRNAEGSREERNRLLKTLPSWLWWSY
jgi:hypothetical protein